MKLVRYGAVGQEKPGIVDGDGNVRDLSGVIADVDGSTLSAESLDALKGHDIASLPQVAAGERLGTCVGNIGKMVCIGLNYSDHAAETGNPIQESSFS